MLYRFCSRILYRCADYTNFRSAETILKTVYDYDGKGFLQQIVNQKLQNLEREDKIDKQTLYHLIQLLKPANGIILPPQFAQGRFLIGNNVNNKFPLHFNWLTATFMKKIYYQEKKNPIQKEHPKLIYKNDRYKCQYIVGAPGLGKSCFFATSKFLHDLKIKYLIKNPEHKNEAIFPDNIKMFYFMPQMTLSQVKTSVLNEMVKDFGLSQKKIRKLKQKNYHNFFQDVKDRYKQKGIKVQYIVDQFDLFYKANIDSEELILYTKTWQTVTSYKSLPTVILSSKNNVVEIHQSKDPLIQVVKSDQNVYKLIIDNQFRDIQTRMLYSYDCLLFDLQKYGISRQTAFQIVTSLQNGFLITHLSSARILEIIQNKNIRVDFFSQKNKQMIKTEIENIIKQIKTQQSQTFIKNIKQIILNKNDLGKQNNLYKFYRQFLAKYKTNDIAFKLIDNKGNEIQKKIQMGYIRQKDFIQNQIIYQNKAHLPNFFYYDETNISDSNYNNNKQNKKDYNSDDKAINSIDLRKNTYIYCSIAPSKLKQIKKLYNYKQYLKYISQCSKKQQPHLVQSFIRKEAGKLFQAEFINLFQTKSKRKLQIFPQLIQPTFLKFEVCGTGQLQIIATNKIYNRKFIKKYANQILTQINMFHKTAEHNFCFDFLISNLTNKNVLQIVLIDTTTGKASQLKITTFQKQLLKLDVFIQILNECARSQKVQKIQLYFCALNCNDIVNVNLCKICEPPSGTAQLSNKLTSVVAFEACFNPRSFSIQDQFKKDVYQGIKDLFKEILVLKNSNQIL